MTKPVYSPLIRSYNRRVCEFICGVFGCTIVKKHEPAYLPEAGGVVAFYVMKKGVVIGAVVFDGVYDMYGVYDMWSCVPGLDDSAALSTSLFDSAEEACIALFERVK